MQIEWGGYVLDTFDATVLSRQEILALYRGKCVVCRKPTIVIHEIEPKSLRRDWQVWSNRITLCQDCHEQVHKTGAGNSHTTLIQYRDRRLLEYYAPDE